MQAVKWAYTANWGERAFSALFSFILAAILGPKDFGTVAIALIYIQFLQLFLDQGFIAALIQKEDLALQHLNTVFWIDMALSTALVGASILFGGWWAARNHAPEATSIISVLSLCIPIEGLAIVQAAILKREMDFKSLSIRSNVAVLVSGIVGLGSALLGFRVWALVIQQITRDGVALLLLWKLSHWRPSFEFSWRHLKDLTNFSLSNFVAQLGIFVDMQLASVLLGLFFGPVTVGLFRLADRLVSSVVAMATTSIQAVSLPEFCRNQNNSTGLRQSALSCIRLSALVTLPALSGLAAVSQSLMAMLGTKWIPATGALQVLCLTGMAMIFAFFTGPLLQATSRPHHLAALEWGRLAVGAIILVAVGLWVRGTSISQEIMGIAAARFITVTLLVMPFFLYILMKECRISVRDLAISAGPAAISSVVVFLSVFVFRMTGMFLNAGPVIQVASQVSVGGVFGSTALLLLDRQLRQLVWENVARGFHSSTTA